LQTKIKLLILLVLLIALFAKNIRKALQVPPTTLVSARRVVIYLEGMQFFSRLAQNPENNV